MFSPQKSSRALSAFDQAMRRWTALPLSQHTESIEERTSRPGNRRTVGKQLSLTSWNIHASPFNASRSNLRVSECTRLILDRILEGPKSPDILFLQGVALVARKSVLDDPRVRSRFLTSDAEDDTAFKGVPFATITLLSNERFVSPLTPPENKDEGKGDSGEREGDDPKFVLDSVFRMTLPSRYKRDALCVNVRDPATPGNVFRLLNVHLESLDAYFRRALQVHLLDRLLREGGCSGGVVAGDFNAIDPDDRTLVEKHGLVDAWVKLHGDAAGRDEGATWGVGVGQLENGLEPGRLDKVIMSGLEPVDIEVLQPGRNGAFTPWSDHCGLRCTFTV
ncbi:Endonuclease/exonuclease/phosphatase [Schizophyllum amplum]|uniref:Endonuclease/exonuclease/phosphatase n=1 Tax=Schizophyllum amplum TaxID=97359 RepID=A0A550C043_9AGAR|nr:Endonuclease/exonuclease/phosphatase [Auriculariopsis ampla]